MAAVIAVNPKLYFPSCPGGKVDVYLAGTTTRSNTWQDRGQTTLNQNPILLDSRGECVAWLDPSKRYKFVVKNSSLATVYTVDNVAGAQPGETTMTQFTTDTFSGTGAQTAFTLSVTPPSEDATSVYVSGVYQRKGTYSVAGTTLTFSVAPASGTDNIEVVTASILDFTAASESLELLVDDAQTAAAAAASSQTAAAASAAAADASADAAAASEAGAAAIVLGNFTQTGTGAVSRTFLDKARDALCILDFVPTAEHAAIKDHTSTYACDTALANAIAMSNRNAIFFPAGRYRFSNTINLKEAVIFQGESGAQAPDHTPETEFVFVPEIVGVFVHRSTTNGGSTGTPSIVAAGNEGATSVFRNIAFKRDLDIATTATTTKHGMWLKGRATIEQCGFYNFDGDGIHIEAYAGSGAAQTEGNANCWQIRNTFSYLNRGNGLYVEGSDANAGYCSGFDASLNSKYGVHDKSFLGNTYVGVHSSANTLGSYKTENSTNATVMIGCYAESGQPAADLTGNTLCIGGLIAGAGLSGTTAGSVLLNTLNSAPFPGMFNTKSIGATDTSSSVISAFYGSDSGTTPTLYMYHATYAPLSWKFMWQGGPDLRFGYGDSGANPLLFTGPSTTKQFGTGANQAGYLLLHRMALGDYANLDGRIFCYGSSAPASGAHAKGEIVFDLSPSAGGRLGWVCVTSGTPGTWVEFGIVKLSGSATYDPPSLADGAGATTTVSVTGAALGDFALASFSLDLQGVTVTAWVSAANTVSVRFQNESGGVVDLASGTLRARVIKA